MRHLERVLAVYECVRVPCILNAVLRHFVFSATVRQKLLDRYDLLRRRGLLLSQVFTAWCMTLTSAC